MSTDTKTDADADAVIEQLQKEKNEVLLHVSEVLEQAIITPSETMDAFGTFSTEDASFFTPYTGINVQEHVTVDRRFLRFFDGNAGQLIIVLFKNGKNQLISVNDRVLTLEHFLQITDMEHVDDRAVAAAAGTDLRGDRVPFIGSVRAQANTREPVIFKNVNIPLIMKAICYLSSSSSEKLM